MLSTDYGFSTSVKRSGHATCWCPALGGIVQFGGWPPSEHLSDVVRHEGSRCPLFYLPITTVARHLHRAGQRGGVDTLTTALSPQRQHRLRELLRHATAGASAAPLDTQDVATSSGAGWWSAQHSTISRTTEEASERGFVYDEGYVSEPPESASSSFSSSSASAADSGAESRPPSPRTADEPVAAPTTESADPSTSADGVTTHAGVIAPLITVDLLRRVAEETDDRMTYGAAGAAQDDRAAAASTTASHGHTSVSRSTHTATAAATAPSTLHGFGRSGGHHAIDREAPPLQKDTREVLGKYTVRPLRWQTLCPAVAPRTRHGHHLVCCGERLYVVGGSYWAHGNALASTDMVYDVRRRRWQQTNALFPPRFCAALARSNAVPQVKWMPTMLSPTRHEEAATMAAQMQDDQVLYYFGGLNYSRALTNTLYRLWLPQETLEELPQYGAVPREQFKGILVCDAQRECNPEERKRGERALGRLFYLDGLQGDRPMAPYLRVYNLANGVWVRVCPSPDLVRSQVSLLQYEPVKEGTAAEALAGLGTRLKRFEVVGGMPSRRGKQRRSRMCYSFDAVEQRFDYSNALPVPGLTAHCTVPLPDNPICRVVGNRDNEREAAGTSGGGEQRDSVVEDTELLADGTTSVAAYRNAIHVLRERYGVWSLCCGGNEDWNDAEQNSLGVPVGWLYLFSPRAIPLSEVARVQMECRHIPMIVPGAAKDELLDELF